MNAANVDRHKQNEWKKKQIRWPVHRRNTRNYGTRPSQKQQKRPQSSGWDYLTVRIRQVSLKSCKISNMTVEILRIRVGYVTTTIVTLMLMAASPGGTTFSKLIEEMSKEELNDCLKCFYTSARKKDATYYKSSSTKSIRTAHWSFPWLAATQQTISHYFWPRFYWKYLRKTGKIAGVV